VQPKKKKKKITQEGRKKTAQGKLNRRYSILRKSQSCPMPARVVETTTRQKPKLADGVLNTTSRPKKTREKRGCRGTGSPTHLSCREAPVTVWKKAIKTLRLWLGEHRAHIRPNVEEGSAGGGRRNTMASKSGRWEAKLWMFRQTKRAQGDPPTSGPVLAAKRPDSTGWGRRGNQHDQSSGWEGENKGTRARRSRSQSHPFLYPMNRPIARVLSAFGPEETGRKKEQQDRRTKKRHDRRDHNGRYAECPGRKWWPPKRNGNARRATTIV